MSSSGGHSAADTERTETVLVRGRWNEAASARLPVEVLRGLHFRNESGGVCRALPRAFLYARLWCDHVPEGTLGHICRESPAPHELLVCILAGDNPPQLYGRLWERARRRE